MTYGANSKKENKKFIQALVVQLINRSSIYCPITSMEALVNSRKLQKMFNLSAPILITGETGTGKSHLAKKIFESSHIHKEKFLTVHLASLKEDLLESELFGHKKGSFTGAFEGKTGYLQDVGKGTLFLDEIGELSLESQKKLLYLLQEKKFSPLGATQSLDFNGRIIMATNKNLEQMMKEGKFREDLYFRVITFKLTLPSLRENKELLKNSVMEIWETLKLDYKKPHSSLSEGAFDFLLNNEWKGNFRELKNSLEYALVMSERRHIEVSDFPVLTMTGQKESDIVPQNNFLSIFPADYGQSLELFEKMYLESILEKNEGRVNETARRLGMSKTTLIQKAKKYQINTLKMRANATLLVA